MIARAVVGASCLAERGAAGREVERLRRVAAEKVLVGFAAERVADEMILVDLSMVCLSVQGSEQ